MKLRRRIGFATCKSQYGYRVRLKTTPRRGNRKARHVTGTPKKERRRYSPTKQIQNVVNKTDTAFVPLEIRKRSISFGAVFYVFDESRKRLRTPGAIITPRRIRCFYVKTKNARRIVRIVRFALRFTNRAKATVDFLDIFRNYFPAGRSESRSAGFIIGVLCRNPPWWFAYVDARADREDHRID